MPVMFNWSGKGAGGGVGRQMVDDRAVRGVKWFCQTICVSDGFYLGGLGGGLRVNGWNYA